MRWVIVLPLPGLLGLLISLEAKSRAFREGVDKLRNPVESRRLFREAADGFDELRQHGCQSPALYLSLGNAEALAGHWPRAIWAYHGGLAMDPNHATLREHLAYARSLVNYPTGGRGRPLSDHWPAWLHRPTANELSIVAGVAWSLAWLAGGAWYLRRQRLLMYATLGTLAVALAAGIGYYQQLREAAYDRDRPLVIVLEDSTPLYKGNGSSYPLHSEMPTLPAGLEARLLHIRGRWLQIELSSGDVGWVPESAVIAVNPLFPG